MELEDLKALVINAVEELKAINVEIMDVREMTSVTDYMLVCSGSSTRHVKSIAENVVTTAKHNGVQPLGAEGLTDGDWALVDLGGVVVHVMLPETRDFYNLEKLWKKVEDAKEKRAV